MATLTKRKKLTKARKTKAKRIVTTRPGRRIVLGSRRQTGDRRYTVSVASNIGGGKSKIFARTPEEAARKAAISQLGQTKAGLRRSTLSVIVTDARGRQSFF